MKKSEVVKLVNKLKGQHVETDYGPSLIRGIVKDDNGKEFVELAEFGEEIYHLNFKNFVDMMKDHQADLFNEEKMEEKKMKKFNAVNKRNGKEFIVTMMEDKAVTFDVEKKVEKEVSLATIKRWFELGEEIVEVKKEKKAPKKAKMSEKEKIQKAQRPADERATKKDGSKRKDDFRPKLDVDQVLEIRAKFREGVKKSHLAKEYGVSFRTITCIVEYIMWKHVA
ncbi:hypothetical protein ACSS31_28995 (plasmid) [Priestia megaterium]